MSCTHLIMKSTFVNRYLLLFHFITVISLSAAGQFISKNNPVIFADMMIGHSWGKTGGLTGGVAMHYQTGKSLISFRYLGTLKMRVTILSPFFPFPLPDQKSGMEEFALMYGWRFIRQNKGYSFSLGPSLNKFSQYYKDANNLQFKEISRYSGASFEANFKWFKKERKVYRLYDLIPIGNPTGFGRSFGFKISGNIAKESYAGLGIAYGLGFHKNY